jgi:hypothetical protein
MKLTENLLTNIQLSKMLHLEIPNITKAITKHLPGVNLTGLQIVDITRTVSGVKRVIQPIRAKNIYKSSPF